MINWERWLTNLKAIRKIIFISNKINYRQQHWLDGGLATFDSNKILESLNPLFISSRTERKVPFTGQLLLSSMYGLTNFAFLLAQPVPGADFHATIGSYAP